MMKIDDEKFEIRVMRRGDLQAIIGIDEGVTGEVRNDYYERKVTTMLDMTGSIATSLVAEYDGKVIGFIMGNIFTGEVGIRQTTASLDTIGIDPEYKGHRIATLLLEEYMANVKAAGVNSIQTLVDWNDDVLLRFFGKSGFKPSQTLNLEKRI